MSGISRGMRALLASTDPRAAEAIDLYVYRVGREIGSLAAALGGVDALVFTGGIGENSVTVRARVIGHLGFLGLTLDEAANRAHGREDHGRITTSLRPRALVVNTNEELLIARDTADILGRA